MTLKCFDRPTPTLTQDEQYIRAWAEAITMYDECWPTEPRSRTSKRGDRRLLAKPPRTRLNRPAGERR